jgi:hypothetical protein
MALIDDMKTICSRLAEYGWKDLFLQHGLDITARNLKNELARNLSTINRNVAGFEDFCPAGCRGIEPGSPGRSLLYHGFASALVHPITNTSSVPRPKAYPTLEELDTTENYLYSVADRRLSDYPNAVVAIFAYQYRIAARSPHRLYADLAFSRTGIGRTGTVKPNYFSARRSFWVEPAHGRPGIAVMPARYAAFLAVPRKPTTSDVILDENAQDKGRTFLFPVHKLFPGKECFLDRTSLRLDFLEFHRNEKLRRVHTAGNIPALNGFRLDEHPFVRDSTNSKDLLSLEKLGASVLLVPKDNKLLVRTATQVTDSGKEELVQISGGAITGRQAPEYVNIRHAVETDRRGHQKVKNLNLLPENKFSQLLRDGGYEAAHFIDDTCDGCISVDVKGLMRELVVHGAYSLITAPDFFPLVDQITITRWANKNLRTLREHFAQGAPDPLSDGRLPVNPDVPDPRELQKKAFARDDQTMTAIVSDVRVGSNSEKPDSFPPIADLSTSYLPDAASNEFAPGWDIASVRDNEGEFYAAYGLGSPFPEDAKLCAALNSYWPAVAPDASRTFARLGTGNINIKGGSPTATPLLDLELGYHPDHPLAANRQTQSKVGWDGEYGPFFVKERGKLFVNYASKERSDYTANSLSGLIHVSSLANINHEELIRRMEALRVCIEALPPYDANEFVSTTKLLLVTAEKIAEWSTRADRGDPRLQGGGYLYVFALLTNQDLPTRDLRRLKQEVARDSLGNYVTFTCQLTAKAICWRQETGTFEFLTLPLQTR